MRVPRAALVISAVLVGCSGSPDRAGAGSGGGSSGSGGGGAAGDQGATGSAHLTGTLGKGPFVAKSVLFVSVPPEKGDESYTRLWFSSASHACAYAADAPADVEPFEKGSSGFLLEVRPEVLAKGEFGGVDLSGEGFFVNDTTCEAEASVSFEKASFTVSSVSSSRLEGTVDVMGANGVSVKGTFSADPCDAIRLDATHRPGCE